MWLAKIDLLPKALLWIVLWLLYFVSGLLPRDPKVWVFGCWDGKRFADNSKWLFDYCHEKKDSRVRIVWISKERFVAESLTGHGYKAHYAWSIKGLYYSLRAGVYVFSSYVSDINFWTSRNAFTVNLWHGIPLKKIERDIDNVSHEYYRQFHGSFAEQVKLSFLYPFRNIKADLITSTSPVVSELLCTAFGVSPARVVETGFPRNDALVTHKLITANSKRFASIINNFRNDGKRVVIYMPTFRDTDRSTTMRFDWSRLDRFLGEHQCVFIVKLHSNDTMKLGGMENLKNIISMPSDIDPYPILSTSDCLITDYSSVYFDYLLLDKQILFFPFDIDQYLQKDRTMYFPYDMMTPGPKAYDFEQLLEQISLMLDDYDAQSALWKPQRATVAQMLHTELASGSSERVYRAIQERVFHPAPATQAHRAFAINHLWRSITKWQ